jgi:DNA-binding FadR family transcriptional regulator
LAVAFCFAVAKPANGCTADSVGGQLRGVIAEGYLVPGTVERGLEAYVKLYECIVNQDADSAYAQMLDYLRDSEMRVRSVDTTKPSNLQKTSCLVPK